MELNYTVKLNGITAPVKTGKTNVGGLNTILQTTGLGSYVSHVKHDIGNREFVDVEIFSNGVVVYTVAK